MSAERWMWNGLTVSDLTGAGSLAVGIIGYFAQRGANRRILDNIADIRRHLSRMETKIDNIISQNKRILDLLDELPKQIRAIVREELRNELNLSTLRERYSSLTRIRNNYMLLPIEERRRYRVHTAGWDELSDIITYLFLHENRLSHVPRLIEACEFAQIAAEKRGTEVVRELVREKQGHINRLFADVIRKFNHKHVDLLELLDSEFIDSYTLDTRSRYKLEYDLAPAKQGTEIILHWPTRNRGWDGEPVEVTVSRPENDAFNNNRLKTDQDIKVLSDELEVIHGHLVHLAGIVHLSKLYGEVLGEDLKHLRSLVAVSNAVEDADAESYDASYFVGYSPREEEN